MTTVIKYVDTDDIEIPGVPFECGDFRGPAPTYETPLVGGVFQGVLKTTRRIPSEHVVSISVQPNLIGNRHQVIQRSCYVVKDGKGVAR